MKKILGLYDFILESIMLESVIYLSDSTIEILNKIKNIPENKWGRTAFIKLDNGTEFRKTSGAATDGKERYESGKYLSKKYIDEYIDKIIKHNGEYISGNRNIYVDIKLKDKNLVADVITDVTYNQMDKKGALDKYDFPDNFINNSGDIKNAERLSSVYNDFELNTSTKVGRVLRGMKIESGHGSKIDDVIIDELSKKIHTYLLNGKFEEDSNKMEMVLEEVTGDDIIFWYNEKNYVDKEKFSDSEGSLHSSCMRYDSCSSYFDIYTMNPDQVSLLVYYDDNDKKLFGRAIIWTNEDGDRVMDTIYSANTTTRNLFKEYREKNCKGNFNNINLDYIEFDEYPYLDTFNYVNIDTNNVSKNDNGGKVASSTSGYLDINGHWSEYENEYIPDDEATYLNYMSDVVRRDSVVEIEQYGDDIYALEEDAVEINGVYYHKQDYENVQELTQSYYGADEFALVDEVCMDENSEYILISESEAILNTIDLNSRNDVIIFDIQIWHESEIENIGEPSLISDEYIVNSYILNIIEELFYDKIRYENDANGYHHDVEDLDSNHKPKYINRYYCIIDDTNLMYTDHIFKYMLGKEFVFMQDENDNVIPSYFETEEYEDRVTHITTDDVEDGDNQILRFLLHLANGGKILGLSYDDIDEEEYTQEFVDIMTTLIEYKNENEEHFNLVKTQLDENKKEFK